MAFVYMLVRGIYKGWNRLWEWGVDTRTNMCANRCLLNLVLSDSTEYLVLLTYLVSILNNLVQL
jgi:hypothetical protein